jgi:molybdopterin molybdotransferase
VIAYLEALAIVREEGTRRATGEEEVPLGAAVGRVLARARAAGEAVPSFDNSGMDGYAVRAAELAGASAERPVTLPVRASLAAGDDPARQAGLGAGGAVEIMTGAPLPAGVDAVVRLEDVEVARDAAGAAARVTFREPVERGRDVRPRGEDFREGDLVAAAGTPLRPEHVMALAGLGEAALPVRRRPRVAVIATGKEVLPHATRALPPGAIRNSTTPYLAAALPAFGAECVSVEAIGDDDAALGRALRAAAGRGADLVLTTGAVSAGRHDFVGAVLAGLDARVRFHGVAVRPGKPVLFATLPGGPAVLGLPGNPVASAASLRFLAAPFLRAALGLAPERPLRAVLAADVKKPQGLRFFARARVEVGPGGATADVLCGQGSAIVSTTLRANAWAVLPEEGARQAAGTEVEVHPPHGLDPWPAPRGEG